jgi:hypothetical protein
VRSRCDGLWNRAALDSPEHLRLGIRPTGNDLAHGALAKRRQPFREVALGPDSVALVDLHSSHRGNGNGPVLGFLRNGCVRHPV